MIAFHSIRPVFVTFTINPVKIFIQVFQWRTLHHHTLSPTDSAEKRRQSETMMIDIGMDPRSLRRKVDIELFIL
jgi:hypothetical protein